MLDSGVYTFSPEINELENQPWIQWKTRRWIKKQKTHVLTPFKEKVFQRNLKKKKN